MARLYTFIMMINLSVFYALGAFAQIEIPDPIVDWQKRVTDTQQLSSLGDNLMGDSIDYNTGAVTFEQTDVTLPGNNALQVAIKRRLSRGLLYDHSSGAEFGDWEIVVPRITALSAEETHFRTGDRCSDHNQFQDVPAKQKINPDNPYFNQFFTPYFRGHEYSHGLNIDSLEYGQDAVLYVGTDPATPFPAGTEYVTKSNFKISCIDNITGGGEGFLAVSPDGIEYRFDRYYEHHTEDQLFSNLHDAYAKRYRSIIAATEVTDVHGNWVKYDYDNENRLTKIHSSDGREITLSYDGTDAPIDEVEANGRT